MKYLRAGKIKNSETMLDIEKLRKQNHSILFIGSYPAIIQSALDYEFHLGRDKPSIKAIFASGRKFERYFFGKKEILLPVYSSWERIPEKIRNGITLFVNVASARRVLTLTVEAIDSLPSLSGGVIFAENVPEKHALDLRAITDSKNIFLIGPASVGLLIPETLKLGAIGGVESQQLIDAHIFDAGSVAVLSASGGMTNEIINIVTGMNKKISFSMSFGGDRFPLLRPSEAFLAAQNDPKTKTIIYFGELGGVDEYEVASLISEKKVTKTVIAYIAGVVAEIFPQAPQFGHAKAMAANQKETARAKRDVLAGVGVKIAESFSQFVDLIESLPSVPDDKKSNIIEDMSDRKHALIASSISKDTDGTVSILGEDLLSFSKKNSFAYIVSSLFLGKKIKSPEFEEFVDFVLRLLVDHGPYVSGAVNTIIASRAGRDLVSSLSAGLLTIGPRFGGAINEAAGNWLEGVMNNKNPGEFVEEFAAKKKYIPGIGHRKYRSDYPDPRVSEIISFSGGLKGKFTSFAREVEKITVGKKGNLILNVDGAIAAVALDILSEKEQYSNEELLHLSEIEFFNALFVLSRSVGFIAHFLDQKRLDEGIFRLEEDQVAQAEIHKE